MKITSDQIEKKAIAGKTKDGRPVVYIATKGGLHAFFCKEEDGSIASIGAAPHKAIARFLAEKKADVAWADDFEKAETDLAKSEGDMFEKLRKVMFMPHVQVLSADVKPSDKFLVYDTSSKTIDVIAKADLEAEVRAGKVDEFALVRDLSLVDRARPLRDHEDFEHLFGGRR